jgi:hypothetical protein
MEQNLNMVFLLANKGYISGQTYIKTLFPLLFITNMISLTTLWLFYPTCQSVNRADMAPSGFEQEIYRTLVEKCDIYDHVDAILDLREKYSLFEMEQLNKEIKNRNTEIISENLERLKEIRLAGNKL